MDSKPLTLIEIIIADRKSPNTANNAYDLLKKMTQHNKLDQDIIITTSSVFDSVTYDNDADSWLFNFRYNISIFATTLWRLLENDRIILVSADHGQQFGLPKPVDAVSELSSLLTRQKLTNIKIKKNTADLILTLTDSYTIEIFISSGGYESYNLHADNKQYIGMGMGNIAIFSNRQ